MGVVSPSQSNPGDTIDASDINNPVNQLAAVINGSIDTANIAASGVGTTQIAASSVTAAKVDFGGSGSGIWWQEIGRTTLGSAGTTITISSFTAKKYLKITGWLPDNGAAIVGSITFNNDSGANYATINSTSGGADSGSASQTSFIVAVDSAATPRYFEIELVNQTAKEKLIQGHTISQNTAGAANIPIRREINGKWANTAAQITRVDVASGTANSFATGAEVVVLGHD